MKFLLDANVFVHLGNHSRGYEQITARLCTEGIEQCALSAITAYELRYLLLRDPRRVKKENIASGIRLPGDLIKQDAAGAAKSDHIGDVTDMVEKSTQYRSGRLAGSFSG